MTEHQPEALAVPGVTSPLESLLHFAAEAHRRKWSYTESSQEAFDALHRIGNEMRAAYDRAREAERAQIGAEAAADPDPGTDPSEASPTADALAREGSGAVPVPPVAAAFDREALRERVWDSLARGWQDDAHLSGLVADAIWPLLEHAQSALTDNEGVRLWMIDCGELVAKHRERAVAAEGKLAAIAALIREKCSYAVTQSTSDAIVRVADILAITGSEEETGNG